MAILQKKKFYRNHNLENTEIIWKDDSCFGADVFADQIYVVSLLQRSFKMLD